MIYVLDEVWQNKLQKIIVLLCVKGFFVLHWLTRQNIITETEPILERNDLKRLRDGNKNLPMRRIRSWTCQGAAPERAIRQFWLNDVGNISYLFFILAHV